jgi:hypothetical protein
MGLRYVKAKSLSLFKNIESPKKRRSILKKSEIKNEKGKKIQKIMKESKIMHINTRAQELKYHYKSHFIQNGDKIPSKIFCIYCCQLGHISIECKFRK